MRKLIIVLLLLVEVAYGAHLEDVRILNVTPQQDGFKLKLQTKDGPLDSYFYVEINKSDSDSFNKLGQVIRKLSQPDKFELNLEIISFSKSPNGSTYRGERVIFYEAIDRAPYFKKNAPNK